MGFKTKERILGVKLRTEKLKFQSYGQFSSISFLYLTQ